MAGRAWPIDAVPADTGDPEYAARHARQASIAPIAGGATAARPLGARSGVRPGTPATTVEVTSTTWTVHQVAGVIDVQVATEAGPYGFAFDADQTGAMSAADGTNPRWDALYVVLDDPAEDDSTVPEVRIEYRDGTAAASPALPADPPDRSFRLCRIVVPQSGGGSPSVVWDPPYLPHQTWLVRSNTERNALATALVPTDEYPLEVLHIGTSNPRMGRREMVFGDGVWVGPGMVTQATGPASQTDYTSTAIVVPVTVQFVAGRKYEICATFSGSHQTAPGVGTVRLAGSAGMPTNYLSFKQDATGETLYGSVVALYEPSSSSVSSVQVTAAASAGVVRIAANAARLWVKDVT